MVPLDLTLDHDLVEATFTFWKEHLQPRLGPEYELGVASPHGITVPRDVHGFTRAMQFSVEGISYADPRRFATDRTERVVSCLKDPAVAALWMYNGGPLSSKHRDSITNAMLLIVQGLLGRLQELRTAPTGAMDGPGVVSGTL